MDPIVVPAPPRSAYNPNRRVSDLILGQLKHFQHVEQKHGKLGIDPALARDIHTEAGAARYIAAITRALRESGAAKAAEAASNLAVLPTPKAAKRARGSGLEIAASSQSHANHAVVKKTDHGAAKRKK